MQIFYVLGVTNIKVTPGTFVAENAQLYLIIRRINLLFKLI
jgi:hypothetical protein